MNERIKVKGHYRSVTRNPEGRFTSVKKWTGRASRTVGWLINRIEGIEDAFVQELALSSVFTRRGKQPKGFMNSLSDEECRLMDEIFELKDWINDMREEENKP